MNSTKLETLRGAVHGHVLTADDHDYGKYSTPWNLAEPQHPAVIVVAKTAADVTAAVHFATENNLGIGVMATGHGVGNACNGGLLINTSHMRNVTIDPQQRTATVEAGALWSDVIGKASEHGLATLAGSAPHVGVVGYTMGGGYGYLGRKFGLNSASVVSASVVLANGQQVRASAHENEELLRVIKGGGGNFGIVVSLEFRLYPVTNVYGGAVYYETGHGRAALQHFSSWAATLPDEVTAAFGFMNVPDIPAAPPMLRGRSLVVLKGCYCGDDLAEGEKIFAPLRKLFTPIADTFGIMPVTAMDAISKDPVDPMGVLQYGALLTDLSPATVDTLLSVAGENSSSPLLLVEVRRLGGALDRNKDIRMLGTGRAAWSLNAIGGAFNPQMAARVQAHLDKLASALTPHASGEIFLNFLETNPGTHRVRAAYTPQDWEELIRLKKKFDSQNLFRFNRNIVTTRNTE